MKNENEHVEMVESEDVANQEQPVIIQPKIIPPRVLLEILVYGTYEPGTDPKESNTYEWALDLQKQIDSLRGKDKFMVRILWKLFEGPEPTFKKPLNEKLENETREWLIENSSCKYYVFNHAFWDFHSDYVKDLLKSIKTFEKGLEGLKKNRINLKKK
jgi:hypothetical protein